MLYLYVDFLVGSIPLIGTNNKHMQTLATSMPSLRSLVYDSGIHISLAFQLVRPIIRAALLAVHTTAAITTPAAATHAATTTASEGHNSDPSTTTTEPESIHSIPDYLIPWYPLGDNIKSVVIEYYSNNTTTGGSNINTTTATSNDNITIENSQNSDPNGVDLWRYVSPEFIILYWTLGLSDLSTPNERYMAEIKKLKVSVVWFIVGCILYV